MSVVDAFYSDHWESMERTPTALKCCNIYCQRMSTSQYPPAPRWPSQGVLKDHPTNRATTTHSLSDMEEEATGPNAVGLAWHLRQGHPAAIRQRGRSNYTAQQVHTYPKFDRSWVSGGIVVSILLLLVEMVSLVSRAIDAGRLRRSMC